MEKIVGVSRKDWTHHKSVLRMSPFRIVYGKSFHLPIQLEHKPYWAIRKMNIEIGKAEEARKMELNKMEER